MDLEHFLEKLEDLLCNGRRSCATDLLIEFLFDIHGKPASLDLCDSEYLSHKSPSEIVTLLRNSLSTLLTRASSSSEYDYQLSSSDLEIIESTSESINSRTQVYAPEEEIHVSPDVTVSLALELMSGGERASGISSMVDQNIQPFHNQSKQAQLNSFEDEKNFSEAQSLVAVQGDCTADIFSDDPELEMLVGTRSVVELPDFTLDEFDDLEDFDEPDHFLEDLPDQVRISLHDRSLQVAIEVGLRFDLDQNEIEFLQEVFVDHGWGNTRIAIERLLQGGVNVDELRLAKQLKDIWAERRDFWMAFYHKRRDATDYTYEGARILSWAFAAKFVRVFPENVDFEEIEYFIDEYFDRWWNYKRKYYVKFIHYLKDIAENFERKDYFFMLSIEDQCDFADGEDGDFDGYSYSHHGKDINIFTVDNDN